MTVRSLFSAWRRRVLLAGFAVSLAACGGGGSTPAAVQPPANTAGPVTLTSPSNAATGLDGTVALAASIEAGDSVAGVEFQVDGVKVGETVTAAPYAASFDATAYASGQHVVRARSVAADGTATDWSTATVSFGGNRSQPAGFTRDTAWLTGLNASTAFVQAPDGRFFIAQQGGTLRVLKNGALLATPLLQLTVNSVGERGLLGVALHPDFANNGWYYVYYTTAVGGIHNRISRFTASGDTTVVGSELVLADLPALGASNHNGGGLHFGIDGKLYVGVGENANPANAQDLSSPLGKLLRFNDDGSIPSDNPFSGTQTGLAQAVWAYGLRNPYTFAIQPGTGRIHINDVGQNLWEEIDLGTAGANYGWPQSEGPSNVVSGITGPLFAYGHSATTPPGTGAGGFFTGIAIIGGAFYPATGGSFPASYAGSYFFADLGSRFVARLDTANGNAAYSFAALDDSPVGMLVGNDGALYVLTFGGITRIAAN